MIPRDFDLDRATVVGFVAGVADPISQLTSNLLPNVASPGQAE